MLNKKSIKNKMFYQTVGQKKNVEAFLLLFIGFTSTYKEKKINLTFP